MLPGLVMPAVSMVKYSIGQWSFAYVNPVIFMVVVAPGVGSKSKSFSSVVELATWYPQTCASLTKMVYGLLINNPSLTSTVVSKGFAWKSGSLTNGKLND